MMKNILIAGIDHALAIPLAARYLALSDAHIFYLLEHTDAHLLDELTTLLSASIQELSPEGSAPECAQKPESRFHILHIDCRPLNTGDPAAAIGSLSASTVWLIGGGSFPSPLTARNTVITSMFNAVLSAMDRMGVSDLNYVSSALGALNSDAPGRLQQKTADSVSGQCAAHNVKYRGFHTSMFLGKSAALGQGGGHDFLHFLALLHDVRAEIEERSPQYFQLNSLRCCMPPKAALSLIHINKLTELLIKAQETAAAGNYSLSSPVMMPFADLCEKIGAIYNVKLLAVDDRRSLNSIDLILDQRMESFRQYLLSSQGSTPGNLTELSDNISVDAAEIPTLIEAIRKSQDQAHSRRKKHVAEVRNKLVKRSLVKNGCELTYFTGGTGDPPLVIVNALGQGLEYWYELIDAMMHYRRVIVWELRGVVAPAPFSLDDQADDLSAILKQEGIRACHFLGWCTGPKVTVRFYLRFPDAVLSMIYLNSTFKWPGCPKQLVSPYEEGLERVCEIFTSDAYLGSLMVDILKKNLEDENAAAIASANEATRAVEVLSKTDKNLLPYIMAPFQNQSMAVNYSRQILEFFGYDLRNDAKQVKAPVLLVSCELDKIANPAMSQAGTEMFPAARWLQIQGSTHYCIHDRAGLVAGLVEEFLLDPKAPLTESNEAQEIAPAACS